jgi:hypothetical protein
MIQRATLRPRPVPPCSERPVENGSKRPARRAGSMPTPLSLSASVALPPARVALISRRPPKGRASSAFIRRMVTT